MKNIVILISGGGSNMASIVRAARQGNWEDRWGGRIAAVLSNRADAGGLRFAQSEGIATGVVDHKAFPSREAFDDALAAAIDAYDPWLVALAGFMRILRYSEPVSPPLQRLPACPTLRPASVSPTSRGVKSAWADPKASAIASFSSGNTLQVA